MTDDNLQPALNRPESLAELIDNISPTIYASLKSAVELGKWSDGTCLSAGQVERCMQAVILYEAENLPEPERTGFDLVTGCAKQQQ